MADPVATGNPMVLENHGTSVQVVDNDIHVAIIEKITDRYLPTETRMDFYLRRNGNFGDSGGADIQSIN
jgi:hypothetical protein